MHKYKQPPEIYRKIIKTKDIRIDYKKVFQQENNNSNDNNIDNIDNNNSIDSNVNNSNEKDVDNINNNNNNVDNTNNNTNTNNINNTNRISIKYKDKIPPKYLSAIKYIPLSIFKLIENLPHPWEDKKVNIIYHIDGMTTIITDKNKIDTEEYKSKWIDFYNNYNKECKDDSYNKEYNEDNTNIKTKDNINTKYNSNINKNISNINYYEYPNFDGNRNFYDYNKIILKERIDALKKYINEYKEEINNNEEEISNNKGEINNVKRVKYDNNNDNNNTNNITTSNNNDNIIPTNDITTSNNNDNIIPTNDITINNNDIITNNITNIFNKEDYINSRILGQPIIYGPNIKIKNNINITDKETEIKIKYPFLFYNNRNIRISNITNDDDSNRYRDNDKYDDNNKTNDSNINTTNSTTNNINQTINNNINNITKKNKISITNYNMINIFKYPVDTYEYKKLLKYNISNYRNKRNNREYDNRKYNNHTHTVIDTNTITHINNTHTNHTNNISMIKKLSKSKYFQSTRIDWLECSLSTLSTSHTLLSNLIKYKAGGTYIYLDYNFNIINNRVLTTKERKKSRLGISIKLLLEELKILKYITDIILIKRIGYNNNDIDCNNSRDNMDNDNSKDNKDGGIINSTSNITNSITTTTNNNNINNITNSITTNNNKYTDIDYITAMNINNLLSNIGIYTGIYRYKYKTMRQIKKCKLYNQLFQQYNNNNNEYDDKNKRYDDRDNIINNYNNTNYNTITTNITTTDTDTNNMLLSPIFYYINYKIYLSYFLSSSSMLYNYLSSLIERIYNKRDRKILKITKQRLLTAKEIELKNNMIEEIEGIVDRKNIKGIIDLYGEMWRMFKCGYNINNNCNNGNDINGGMDVGSMDDNNGNNNISNNNIETTNNISINNNIYYILYKYIKHKIYLYKSSTLDIRNKLYKDNINDIDDRTINVKDNTHTYNSSIFNYLNKNVLKKNIGRICRLYIMKEIKRQREYLIEGSDIDSILEIYNNYITLLNNSRNNKCNSDKGISDNNNGNNNYKYNNYNNNTSINNITNNNINIYLNKNKINNAYLYKRAIKDLLRRYKNIEKQSEIEEYNYLESLLNNINDNYNSGDNNSKSNNTNNNHNYNNNNNHNNNTNTTNNIIINYHSNNNNITKNNDINIKLIDNIKYSYICYNVNIRDKVIDKYIEYYLCNRIYINSKCIIRDSNMLYISINNTINDICNSYNNNNTTNNNSNTYPNPNTIINSTYPNPNNIINNINILRIKISVLPYIDHYLLKNILLLFIDNNMVDIIMNRISSNINYKDMNYNNNIGVIEGLEYSYIIFNIIMLYYDYNYNNCYNSDNSDNNNDNNGYKCDSDDYNKNDSTDNNHTTHTINITNTTTNNNIKYYFRYLNDLYFVIEDITKIDRIIDRVKNIIPNSKIIEYKLYHNELDIDNYHINININKYNNIDKDSKSDNNKIYDNNKYNKNINTTNNINTNVTNTITNNLNNNINIYKIEYKANDRGIMMFECLVKKIIISVDGSTYISTINKWNRLLLSIVLYYREYLCNNKSISDKNKNNNYIDINTTTTKNINNTTNNINTTTTKNKNKNILLEKIKYYENKLKMSIKQTLNSKMDTRFPRVVFYSPRDLGGLGMYIIGLDGNEYDHNYKYNKKDRNKDVISIMDYVDNYNNYNTNNINYKDNITNTNNTNTTNPNNHTNNILIDNNNLYKKIYKKYNSFNDLFYFIKDKYINFNTDAYRKDVIKYFGGINKILDYSIYRAINVNDNINILQYEEDNNYNYKDNDKDNKDNNTTTNNNINNTTNNTNDINAKNMTLAQRRGLSTIPNKKFTLWWSPCINTSNVYVGYITVLDGTGIFMHGKIPTLKLNYINMFRDRLWIKIHKSIVDKIYNEINNIYNGDINNNYDRNKNNGIDGYDNNNKIDNNIPNIKLLPTHKRKSLRMSNGAADILIENMDSIFITECNNKYNCNDGDNECNSNKYNNDINNTNANINNNITNNNITNININTIKNNIYIDIQLRWGDYSKKDIHKYAKRKYLEYNNDPLSFYPCDKGLIIVYDLCYNTYSYYGYIPTVLYKHNSNRDDDNAKTMHDNNDNIANGDNINNNNLTTTNNNNNNHTNNNTNNHININNITAINNILDNISKNNRYLITLRERIKNILDIKSKRIEYNSITEIYNKIHIEYKNNRIIIFYKGYIEYKDKIKYKEYISIVDTIIDIINDNTTSNNRMVGNSNNKIVSDNRMRDSKIVNDNTTDNNNTNNNHTNNNIDTINHNKNIIEYIRNNNYKNNKIIYINGNTDTTSIISLYGITKLLDKHRYYYNSKDRGNNNNDITNNKINNNNTNININHNKIINIYGNWDSITEYTKFCRMYLIAKSSNINYNNIFYILKEYNIYNTNNINNIDNIGNINNIGNVNGKDDNISNITNIINNTNIITNITNTITNITNTITNKLFKNIEDSIWIDIEYKLRDIIINNYITKNNINRNRLNNKDIKNIILGKDINIEEDKEEVIIRTVNKLGEEIISKGYTNKDNNEYNNKDDNEYNNEYSNEYNNHMNMNIKIKYKNNINNIINDDYIKEYIYYPYTNIISFIDIEDGCIKSIIPPQYYIIDRNNINFICKEYKYKYIIVYSNIEDINIRINNNIIDKDIIIIKYNYISNINDNMDDKSNKSSIEVIVELYNKNNNTDIDINNTDNTTIDNNTNMINKDDIYFMLGYPWNYNDDKDMYVDGDIEYGVLEYNYNYHCYNIYY